MDTSWKPPRFLKRRESELSFAGSFSLSVSLDQFRQVLSLPPAARTGAHITLLMTATKSVKLFTELRDLYGEFAQSELCRYLTYQENSGEDLVFAEGQEGSTFYTILSGSCAVIVLQKTPPSTEKKPLLLSILRTGDSFGELALLYRKPRAAGVLCREDCSFAVLERRHYLETLSMAKERHQVEKLELLKRHPIFAVWPEEVIALLAQRLRMKVLKRKQVLVAAGQKATHLFLIKSGNFQLTKECSSFQSRNGCLQPIRYQDEFATMGRGELLGVRFLAYSQPWLITCVCISPEAEVLAIGKKHFESIAINSYAALMLLEQRRDERQQRLKALRKPPVKAIDRSYSRPAKFAHFQPFAATLSREGTFTRAGSLPNLTCPVPENLDDLEAAFKLIQRI